MQIRSGPSKDLLLVRTETGAQFPDTSGDIGFDGDVLWIRFIEEHQAEVRWIGGNSLTWRSRGIHFDFPDNSGTEQLHTT